MVDPDLLEMNLRIESINKTVSEAVENVSKSNQKLLNILDKNEVVKNEIKTTQYSINPQYRYDNKTGKSELLQASKIWDIEYKQRVSVTSDDSIVVEINRIKKK